MTNAIHLICKKDRGLAQPQGGGVFYSACWLIGEPTVEALQGGWVYLHEVKGEPAYQGGKILDFERCEREETTTPVGMAIYFEEHPAARDVVWRGHDQHRNWTGWVVAADLPHENEH